MDPSIPIPTQEYNLDPEAVSSYLKRLEELNPIVSGAVKKIIDGTYVVHFKHFLELLDAAVEAFMDTMTDNYIVCISALDKSEMWVVRLINHLHPELELELNRNVFLIKDLPELEVENVVIFDDGSFSGIHMINMVENIKSIVDVNVYIVTGLTTNTAINHLMDIIPEENVYFGKLLTTKVGGDEEYGLLNPDEIDAIKSFYRLEDGDNSLEDFYPVFFDHKMPGVFSSVPFIYAGLIPTDDGWEENPLISGCEKGSYLKCPPVPYRSNTSN